jgi:hypothetical protein
MLIGKIKHPWRGDLVNVKRIFNELWRINDVNCFGLYFGDSDNRIITKITGFPPHGYPTRYLLKFLKTYCNDF